MRVFTVRYVSGVFSHEGEALHILSQYGKDWRYSAHTHRGSHFFGEIKFNTFVVGLTIFFVDAGRARNLRNLESIARPARARRAALRIHLFRALLKWSCR